jgi:hypothetical protein
MLLQSRSVAWYEHTSVVISRRAEVKDSVIVHADLDPAAVNQRLSEHGIIVRAAICTLDYV